MEELLAYDGTLDVPGRPETPDPPAPRPPTDPTLDPDSAEPPSPDSAGPPSQARDEPTESLPFEFLTRSGTPGKCARSSAHFGGTVLSAVENSAETAPAADDPPVATRTPAPRSWGLLSAVLVPFLGAFVVTLIAVLVPWLVFVSPQIDAARQARRAAMQPPPPTIVEVPKPVIVPQFAPPEAAAGEDDSTDADDDSEDASAENAVQDGPTAVRPAPRPRPRARPRPRQPARSTSRFLQRAEPEPAEESAAKSDAEDAKTAADASKSSAPEPEPAPAAEPVPAAARVLGGRMTGRIGGDDAIVELAFQPGNRVTATIRRANVVVKARGTYRLDGDEAWVNLRGDESSTFSGTASRRGLFGHAVRPDGDRDRLKVKR